MADRTIMDYINNLYTDVVRNAVVQHINDRAEKWYNLRKSGVTADTAIVDSVKIIFANAGGLLGSLIDTSIVVDTAITVKKHYPNSSRLDHHYRSFVVNARIEMDDTHPGMDIVSVEPIEVGDHPDEYRHPLTNSLIPIIAKDDLDSVAFAILDRFMPDALHRPMAVDAYVLAETLGLQIAERQLSDDGSVFGRILFADATLCIDPDTFFRGSVGCKTNTIVHECVHWLLHRKSFLLLRSFGTEDGAIDCPTTGLTDSKALAWMEWQANSLAPRIQMPAEMFRAKAAEIIREEQARAETDDLLDVIEPVINNLASFFEVSCLAAKIRMVEIGYDEAIGSCIYLDGQYVPPHLVSRKDMQAGITYSIGEDDAIAFAETDTEYGPRIQEGQYRYVESHFVLDDPRHVEEDETGTVSLTPYARRHMDECCVKYTLYHQHFDVQDGYALIDYLDRNLNNKKPKRNTVPFLGGGLCLCNDPLAFPKGIEGVYDLYEKEIMECVNLPNNLPEAFKKVRSQRNYTTVSLEICTKIDHKTVMRLESGESMTGLDNLVKLFLAMHLSPMLSYRLLTMSPHRLVPSNPKHRKYLFALIYLSGYEYQDIKRFLD